MATGSGSAAVGPSQEFVVRAPRNPNKKVSILKFSRTNKVDFAKCGPVKIERENNLRQYKASHDLEMLPKFGAGSEFGREQKEEARRKKYGVMLKRYDPENQPWILKTGQGKETRRFKGTREGGISENTSYYIFTQCPDGAFEAVPVNDWYTFNPVINYRHLTMEEAEEEFERRDKTLNYFSIMVKKRLNKEDVGGDDDLDDGEGGGKKKKASKKKGFMMMDKDDWTDEEDDEDDDDDDEDGDKDDEERQKKKDIKAKGKKKPRRPVKNSKKNDNDEAIEESDEGDYDDKEVDYITDSESTDDSDLDIMGDRYREQGVNDEDGLRKLNESGESEDEDEEKKPEEEEAPAEENKEKPKEAGSDSESSSDSSDSDDSDDLEQGGKFLFMGGGKPKKEPKKDKKEKKEKSGANSNSASRSSTPVSQAQEEENAKKRKLESDAPQNAKKSKVDSSLHPSASAPSLSAMQSSLGITEDNIRRYLTRKPMTTKDLLQKFKSKKPGESKEHLVTTVAQLLKKINPEKTVIKGKMYLFLKKPE